jgi:FlaG protein
MEHGLTPIGPVAKPDGQAAPTRRPLAAVYSTPKSPPPELRQELDVAAQVIEQLSQQQVNLHFEVDEQAGSVRVQVLDSKGNVLREIPARSLLDTLSGGGLLVDQRG